MRAPSLRQSGPLPFAKKTRHAGFWYCVLAGHRACFRFLDCAHTSRRDMTGLVAGSGPRRPVVAISPYLWRKLVQKTASARWSGGIKDGKGYISTQTGVLKDAPYGFASRFEEGPGTNPEELVGAAHSGCFTMALSLQLTEAGLKAESIETKSTVTLEKDGGGFSITACHLDVKAKVPGTDKATFEKLANAAKEGCPVSKLFAGNAKITLNTEFVS
jgi:osmotically inducible protein OsmC